MAALPRKGANIPRPGTEANTSFRSGSFLPGSWDLLSCTFADGNVMLVVARAPEMSREGTLSPVEWVPD